MVFQGEEVSYTGCKESTKIVFSWKMRCTRIAFEESMILNFSRTFLCSKVEFQSVPKGMTRPIANEANGVYKVPLKISDEHELTSRCKREKNMFL